MRTDITIEQKLKLLPKHCLIQRISFLLSIVRILACVSIVFCGLFIIELNRRSAYQSAYNSTLELNKERKAIQQEKVKLSAQLPPYDN